MQNSSSEKQESAKLFDNRFLEALTRTPFWLPVGLFYAISAGILVFVIREQMGPFIQIVLLFWSGFLFFTLVEYLIHRFFFHFKAESEKQKKVMYTIHGVHHAYPRDKQRLVMPVILSITLAGIFFVIFKIFIPDQHLLVFSGFVAGYSSYLLIHYSVHAFRPPKNLFRIFWKHHALHHFKSEKSAFAVSFPLWDYLLGTMPEKNK